VSDAPKLTEEVLDMLSQCVERDQHSEQIMFRTHVIALLDCARREKERKDTDEMNLISHVTLVGELELAKKRIAELEREVDRLRDVSEMLRDRSSRIVELVGKHGDGDLHRECYFIHLGACHLPAKDSVLNEP
jgi:hypothetical protein